MTDQNILIGAITDKSVKESPPEAAKQWKRTAFTVMDQKLSTFDATYDVFNVGEVVEIEYELSGQYKNIKSMKKSDKAPELTPTPDVSNAVPIKQPGFSSERGKDTEASKNASIILSYACKLVEKCIETGKIEQVTAENLVQNVQLIAERLIKVYKAQKKELLKDE